MKTSYTSFPRNKIKFLAFALFSLLLVNCSKKDVPQTYEFKEFENLSELPNVADPDPEISEPNLGSINDSEATKKIIADIKDESVVLLETTKNDIATVSNFADGLTTDIQDEVLALDAAKIGEILNASELSLDYAALSAELETLPADVAALFPYIQFSDDYNRAQEHNKQGVVINNLKADFLSQSASGPCFDAVLAAYNSAMIAPSAQRDEQLAILNSNYDARITAANSRNDDRTATLNTMLIGYDTFVYDNAIVIIAYADSISSADAELSLKLRKFTLLYVVKSYILINTFQTEATGLIEDTLTSEINTIDTVKADKTQLVQRNFVAVKAEADALRTSAYRKCHNQGSGN